MYKEHDLYDHFVLEEFLLSQGCEFMVPGVIGFFQFMFDNRQTDYRLYGGKARKKVIAQVGAFVAERMEKEMLDVLKDFPCFTSPAPFSHIRELGDRVIGRGVKMGEGWLLTAEMLELVHSGYTNIICAQPFGCLPNHIAGRGMINKIKEIAEEANILAIDYDASASKVNQENRIKLMLATAK